MCFETECMMVVQGHPRSLILAPIESTYATSYWSSIVTLVLSCPVSEILQVFLLRRATRPLFHPNFVVFHWSRLPLLWLPGAKTLSVITFELVQHYAHGTSTTETDRQRNRRTGRWLNDSNTALALRASRGNKTEKSKHMYVFKMNFMDYLPVCRVSFGSLSKCVLWVDDTDESRQASEPLVWSVTDQQSQLRPSPTDWDILCTRTMFTHFRNLFSRKKIANKENKQPTIWLSRCIINVQPYITYTQQWTKKTDNRQVDYVDI